MCHLVRRNSSAIKSDRVEIAFILALFDWLKPLPDEGLEGEGEARKPEYPEKTPDDELQSHAGLLQVVYSVAALAKSLYNRMFEWLVKRVNKTLDTKNKRQFFIGVLDIAGFEIFDVSTLTHCCLS